MYDPLIKITNDEADMIIEWCAAFHACFIGNEGDGLFKIGTYWHLETRQEELRKMKLRVFNSSISEFKIKFSSKFLNL